MVGCKYHLKEKDEDKVDMRNWFLNFVLFFARLSLLSGSGSLLGIGEGSKIGSIVVSYI